MTSKSVTWKDNPFMLASKEEMTAHSSEWAFVVLLFKPPKANESLEQHLLQRSHCTLMTTQCLDTSYPPDSIQQDGTHLTYFYSDPNQALSAGLQLQKLHQHLFHIAVGFGLGYQLDYIQCQDELRVKAVLPFGNTTEIQASPNLLNAIDLPDGIGSFQCSPALAQKCGMHYWILKDYRSH